MDNISVWGLFGLGIITSLSPCSLALLVVALSFVIAEEKNLREGICIGISFTLGMSLVFFILGFFLSKSGQFLRLAYIFYIIAGILLVLFGLRQLDVFKRIKLTLFSRNGNPGNVSLVQQLSFSVLSLSRYSKNLSAFLLGVLFAFGWAPCGLSLIMPVALLIMSQDLPVWHGGALLFIFGLGHGAPIIPLAALSGEMRSRLTNRFTATGRYLTRILGVIILVIGILFVICGPKINTIFVGR